MEKSKPMDVRLPAKWKELLGAEFQKPYFGELAEFVRSEYVAATLRTGVPIYPAAKNIFRAFDKCDLADLRVVVIGQDPYHGMGQASGLCFSVAEGIALPPSLRNIFKEVQSDVGTPIPTNGNLDRWAEQGVLLLNATLTVRARQANSHANAGWQIFTDAVVRRLNDTKQGVVYMLWGGFAQRKGQIVDRHRNCVLTAAHPSPLSAYNGFFGCRHFSKTNHYLETIGKTPIKW
jgi:uracil-DNA glycosylase